MVVAVFFTESLDALFVGFAACSVMSAFAAIGATDGSLVGAIGRCGICHVIASGVSGLFL